MRLSLSLSLTPIGELSAEATEEYERARKLHEKLLSGCSSLAELLLAEVPYSYLIPAIQMSTVHIYSAI